MELRDPGENIWLHTPPRTWLLQENDPVILLFSAPIITPSLAFEAVLSTPPMIIEPVTVCVVESLSIKLSLEFNIRWWRFWQFVALTVLQIQDLNEFIIAVLLRFVL